MATAPTVDYGLVESFLIALGLEPKYVREIKISAVDYAVTVTTYSLDADGSKFVDPESGKPAVDVTVRKISGVAA